MSPGRDRALTMRTSTPRAALALLLGACTTGEVVTPPPLERDVVTLVALPVWAPRPLDLVLVIDNSPAMAPYLPTQAANLRTVAATLEQWQWNFVDGLEAPDLHLAVITTDVGGPGSRFDDGAFQRERHVPDAFGEHVEPCEMLAADATFIVDAPHPSIAGARARNYQGSLGDVLACVGSVGARGASFAAPLEALRRALDRAARDDGDARGFLRPEALLQVVIISASDDCSPPTGYAAPALWSRDAALGALDPFRCAAYGLTCDQPLPRPGELGPDPGVALTGCVPSTDDDVVSAIEPHVAWLRRAKPNPRDVQVGVVAGPTSPLVLARGAAGAVALQSTCTDDDAPRTATAAVRLDRFRREFVDRSEAVNVCTDDFTDAVFKPAELLAGAVGDPCLQHPLADRNEALPGLQPECAAAFTPAAFGAAPPASATVVPTCDAEASSRPCWRFVEELACANDPAANLAVDLVWPAERPRPGVLRVQCSVDDEVAP